MRKHNKVASGCLAVATAITLTACRGSSGAETKTESSGSGGDTAECPETTDGLTADSIKLGGSYPLSGSAAAYSSIPKGVNAWFQHLNDTDGGFKLKDGSTLKIDWTYLDDQYTPAKTSENAKQLVEQDKVFLLFNTLGTPPNTAIRDYMNQKEVPQMMVATGASKWGKEIDQFPWTIGYQPDYESEGIAYAKYILEQNPDAKIGVIYQNDDFGKDYLTGLKEGLGDKASQIVSEVTYETTDATVDNQISQIKDSGADAFVIVAIPSFAIQAIKKQAELRWEPPIKIVNGVATSVAGVMEPAGFENADGYVSSFYLKA